MPKSSAHTLVLRPADPFDLIRWLARSQSDPRKAVAELVQNSIDAQARHIAIERRRRMEIRSRVGGSGVHVPRVSGLEEETTSPIPRGIGTHTLVHVQCERLGTARQSRGH